MRTLGVAGSDRQPHDHEIAQLVGDDIADDPRREPAGGSEACVAPVEPQSMVKAHTSQGRDESDRLQHDTTGGAELENQLLRM